VAQVLPHVKSPAQSPDFLFVSECRQV
jgi:hypothetical protein